MRKHGRETVIVAHTTKNPLLSPIRGFSLLHVCATILKPLMTLHNHMVGWHNKTSYVCRQFGLFHVSTALCNIWVGLFNSYEAAILVLHSDMAWWCNACLFWLVDIDGIALSTGEMAQWLGDSNDPVLSNPYKRNPMSAGLRRLRHPRHGAIFLIPV